MNSENSKKIDDFHQKIEALKHKNAELSVSVTQLQQEKQRLIELAQSFEEQRLYYEKLKLSQSSQFDDSKSEFDSLLSKGGNTSRNQIASKEKGTQNEESCAEIKEEEDEEEKLIVIELEKLLRESINRNKDFDFGEEKEEENFSNFNLFCGSVMVFFIYSENAMAKSLNYFCQTFKIDVNTTFADLRNSIFTFWEIDPDFTQDYSLKLIGEDCLLTDINGEHKIIDTFLRGIPTIRYAKFAFYLTKYNDIMPDQIKQIYIKIEKSAIEDKNEETQDQKKSQNQVTLDPSVEKLFRSKFLGLSSYLINKYIHVKKKELMNLPPQKKNFCINACSSCFHLSLIILFTIFTLQSLFEKVPLDYTFAMHSAIHQAFIKESTMRDVYSDLNSIKKDLASRLRPIFWNGTLWDSVKVLSTLRVSFFRVLPNSGRCNSLYANWTGNKSCYSHFYSLSASDTSTVLPFWKDLSLYKKKLIEDGWDTQDFTNTPYYVQSSQEKKNYITGYPSLVKYYDALFSGFSVANTRLGDSFYCLGELSSYYGMAYDLNFNTQNISSSVLELALDISSYDPFLWDKGLKAIVSTVTFFHYQSQFLYYVRILYEVNPDGSVLTPIIKIDPFQLNIYSNKYSTLFICDMVRIVCSLGIFAFLVKKMYTVKNALIKKNEKAGFFRLLMKPKIFLSFLYLILYWISCGIKIGIFYQDNCNYGQVDTSTYEWPVIQKEEFFYQSTWYLTDNIIESGVVLFILWRLLLSFHFFGRIRQFSAYVFSAFAHGIPLFITIFVIIVAFAISANNLFGHTSKEFMNLPGSLTHVMLFTISHYSINLSEVNDEDWLLIFMTLLIFTIVFFLMSSFVGLYIEAYRISSLRKGYSYDRKMKDSEKLFKTIKDIKNLKNLKIKANPKPAEGLNNDINNNNNNESPVAIVVKP